MLNYELLMFWTKEVVDRFNWVESRYWYLDKDGIPTAHTGGIGVELKTGIGTFGLEGRYYFGLSDIFNNSKKDYFARSANSTISVRAAYMFSVTR